MTSLTSYFFSSIKSAYNNINPSTLTGAIDIIVVQQEDGTLRCTPFHVRFGKLGVLRNQKNKVYIIINGNPVEDLYMELGEAGEALFIVDDNVTHSLSPSHHLESLDSNIFLDPDASISTDSQSQSFNIDSSPQIINKEVDEQKTQEKNETPPEYACTQPLTTSVEVNILNSNVVESKRRRTKRRINPRIERVSDDINEDEDQEIKRILSSTRERSRARQRASTSISMNENSTNNKSNEQRRSSLTISRQHSASENDLLLFQLDDEKQSTSSTPFVDAHSRMNSIDSRKKLLIIPPRTSNDSDSEESYSSSLDESADVEETYRRNTRGLSSPIPIEPKSKNEDTSVTTDESNSLVDTGFSQSAPVTNIDNSVPLRMTQSNDSTSLYLNENFSTTLPYDTSIAVRPESPKSDTEYELDKSSQQSARNTRTGFLWQWKWGELPEQRRSVFRYLWPSSSSSSSKPNAPKEGIYLDDITNNKCDDRSRYLPQMDYQSQSRTPKDDDQESGTGNSIPQSPVRELEASHVLGDVQLSLCGNLDKISSITDDLFNTHLIPYEKFANNPSIINDPNLVVRIGGKFHSWNVASALIASASVYRKQLPPHIVEKLQEKQVEPAPSRTTSGISLWPFSGKSSNKKAQPIESAALEEALALVVKSEVVPTILQNPVSFQTNTNENDQEDQEVKKLTDKIEQQQVAQNRATTLKRKTMTLTSEQLKRLNLKCGVNHIEFSVTTALQGTTVVQANIFLYDHTTKFVISDIDGTITKSDVFGHILPFFGKDWSHDGIAEFFQAIQENGYQFLYLSARAIGQGQITRNFLRSVRQCGFALPIGPLLISPDTLVAALYREVIARRPEEFKIECLKNIASLFPNKNPFYAGFGNRLNDQSAYIAVGIPETRIFTINPRGEVVRHKISQVLSTSYKNLHEVVDQVFPPMDSFSASESYSSFTFWREKPSINEFEDEMLHDLEEMARRQKVKGKGTTAQGTSISIKGTSTTTVIKSGGEKFSTIAQATEYTVKKT